MFCCRPDWRSSDADDAGGIGPGCRRPPMRTAMRCAPPHPFRRPWLLIVGGGRGIARVRVAIAAEPIHVRAEPAREQHAEDRHPHCPPIRRRCRCPPSRPSTVCIALVWEFPSSSVCKVALDVHEQSSKTLMGCGWLCAEREAKQTGKPAELLDLRTPLPAA